MIDCVNFYDVIKNNCIFVDKIIVIKTMLKLKVYHILVTTSRQYGKSYNLGKIWDYHYYFSSKP